MLQVTEKQTSKPIRYPREPPVFAPNMRGLLRDCVQSKPMIHLYSSFKMWTGPPPLKSSNSGNSLATSTTTYH